MKNEVPVKKVFTILVLGRNSLEYFLPSYTESLASSWVCEPEGRKGFASAVVVLNGYLLHVRVVMELHSSWILPFPDFWVERRLEAV